MKFTLRPSAGLEGPLTALEQYSVGSVFTPVDQVLDCVAGSNGRLVRRGDFNIVVDIEPTVLDRVMPQLRGWVAQPVQKTSSVTAFDGMLTHIFGTDRSSD